MLNRLLPEQVAKFWDIVKYAVTHSLPPTIVDHPDNLNRVLAAALSGEISVWVSYKKEESSTIIEGVVLTNFLYDSISNTRSLLIYSVFGYKPLTDQSWTEGIKALAKYAKSRDCVQIVAYTNSNSVIKVVESLGGEASYTFISFNIDKLLEN